MQGGKFSRNAGSEAIHNISSRRSTPKTDMGISDPSAGLRLYLLAGILRICYALLRNKLVYLYQASLPGALEQIPCMPRTPFLSSGYTCCLAGRPADFLACPLSSCSEPSQLRRVPGRHPRRRRSFQADRKLQPLYLLKYQAGLIPLIPARPVTPMAVFFVTIPSSTPTSTSRRAMRAHAMSKVPKRTFNPLLL